MKATKVESISAFQNAHGVEAKKLYATKNAEVIFNALLGLSLARGLLKPAFTMYSRTFYTND